MSISRKEIERIPPLALQVANFKIAWLEETAGRSPTIEQLEQYREFWDYVRRLYEMASRSFPNSDLSDCYSLWLHVAEIRVWSTRELIEVGRQEGLDGPSVELDARVDRITFDRDTADLIEEVAVETYTETIDAFIASGAVPDD